MKIDTQTALVICAILTAAVLVAKILATESKFRAEIRMNLTRSRHMITRLHRMIQEREKLKQKNDEEHEEFRKDIQELKDERTR